MSTPEEAARRQVEAFHVAKERNPDLLPYMGPEDTLNRFLAGDVVNREDMLTDKSLFTVRPILPTQMRRLRWMLDNLKGAAGA